MDMNTLDESKMCYAMNDRQVLVCRVYYVSINYISKEEQG
jgi:hypothetical protein